jgi:hypothetical protein
MMRSYETEFLDSQSLVFMGGFLRPISYPLVDDGGGAEHKGEHFCRRRDPQTLLSQLRGVARPA